MISVELPWPPAELFPNKANRWHGHHGYARKAKMLRTLAWGLAAAELGPRLRKYDEPGDIILHTELTPPNRAGRPADEDGCMAALKAARDGLADALGVNDSRFRQAQPVWRPRAGNGKVVISF